MDNSERSGLSVFTEWRERHMFAATSISSLEGGLV